jgi:hypothetical protein
MGQIRRHTKTPKSVGLKALADKLVRFSPTKAHYSVEEVMAVTELSRERVSYLWKAGLIASPLRTYSASRKELPLLSIPVHDVLKALIITDIRNAKFSLQKVRKVAKHLEELGMHLDPSAYLLTDGKSIKVATTNDEVVDVLKHHRQMFLLVSLETQIEKLKAA